MRMFGQLPGYKVPALNQNMEHTDCAHAHVLQ